MVVGAAVMAVVLVALAFWYVALPHWRPALRDGEVYGVDVSHHQGTVDWTRVADDGIEFAYIKASEGGDFRDDLFTQNWRAAADVGLPRGAYHFFTLCRPGREQARWFVEVAPPDPDALPPALDLELAGNCSERPEAAAVNAEVAAFLEIVEEAWHRPVILYVGDDYEGVYPVPEALERDRWKLGFLRRPDVANLVIWQVHGFAHIDGVNGDADLNLGRLEDLRGGDGSA